MLHSNRSAFFFYFIFYINSPNSPVSFVWIRHTSFSRLTRPVNIPQYTASSSNSSAVFNRIDGDQSILRKIGCILSGFFNFCSRRQNFVDSDQPQQWVSINITTNTGYA